MDDGSSCLVEGGRGSAVFVVDGSLPCLAEEGGLLPVDGSSTSAENEVKVVKAGGASGRGFQELEGCSSMNQMLQRMKSQSGCRWM